MPAIPMPDFAVPYAAPKPGRQLAARCPPLLSVKGFAYIRISSVGRSDNVSRLVPQVGAYSESYARLEWVSDAVDKGGRTRGSLPCQRMAQTWERAQTPSRQAPLSLSRAVNG